MTEKTDFGYQQIPINEKTERVSQIFSSVANKYDVMNDAMSFGLHRIWKYIAITIADIKAGQTILDLAGGTGDLTALISKKLGCNGTVTLADLNIDMIQTGRDKLINEGLLENICYLGLNAEQLSFKENSFDRVIIGFGLRNVARKEVALKEIYRVLKPSGKLIILEFSTCRVPFLKQIYNTYSFSIIPRLGQLIAGDSESYRYLVESIRKHPDQATLKSMLQAANFFECEYYNLCGGIVAVHVGFKI